MNTTTLNLFCQTKSCKGRVGIVVATEDPDLTSTIVTSALLKAATAAGWHLRRATDGCNLLSDPGAIVGYCSLHWSDAP